MQSAQLGILCRVRAQQRLATVFFTTQRLLTNPHNAQVRKQLSQVYSALRMHRT